jgi:hypothetical protein
MRMYERLEVGNKVYEVVDIVPGVLVGGEYKTLYFYKNITKGSNRNLKVKTQDEFLKKFGRK